MVRNKVHEVSEGVVMDGRAQTSATAGPDNSSYILRGSDSKGNVSEAYKASNRLPPSPNVLIERLKVVDRLLNEFAEPAIQQHA